MPFNFTSLLWFALVVAAIPAVLWLVKRTPLAGGGGAPGTPRPVAVLPLSAQHKLVTVEVGQGDARQWLVLGVSPQGIRTLHTMAAQGPVETSGQPAPAAPPFAQLLARVRGSDQPKAPDAR